MHMARLADPSRSPQDYSLANLSRIYSEEISQAKEGLIRYLKEANSNNPEILKNLELYKQQFQKTHKIDIKNTFAFYKKLKSGEDGKILQFPDIEDLHTNEKYIKKWVEYATFDAEITYFLREPLAKILSQLEIPNYENMNNLYQLYCKYWLPFGEILTEMEREGFKIDLHYLEVKYFHYSSTIS